jgi:hypothetical protein
MKTKLTLFVAVFAAALFLGGCATTEPAFVSDGLVAYYPFNGNAKDESGNGNDGEVKGANIINGHAQFNGVSDIITSKCESLPQGKLPRTLSFWAKADRPKAFTENMVGWGLSKKGGTSFGSYVGRGHFAFFGWGLETYDFNASPSDEYFHHHCVTHNGKIISYYIDGKNMKSSEVGDRDTVGNDLIIGARTDGRFNFKGSIDDVRIYNRALSAEEVKALYDLEKPKK